MSYDAKVFNVMIASPSDVASERSIIRKVIYDWNAVHSAKEGIVLLPVGWESHSSPEMGARPQAIINKQTVDKCDFLVAVFGTRIGTETGEYRSGTVEEIQTHIDSGKPAMVYFSKQLGDAEKFNIDQYAELLQFKEDNKDQGLFEHYDGDLDLKDKFYRHLQHKVNEHEIFQFQSKETSSGLEMAESTEDIPQLSDEAKILLKEASQGEDGYISYLLFHGETIIQTNGKNMIPNQKPRVVAQWKDALEQLKNAKLLESEDSEGGTFYVTARGYEIADTIDIST